jgi:MFS family permease
LHTQLCYIGLYHSVLRRTGKWDGKEEDFLSFTPAKPPIARNIMLLSAGMAALYGMTQLSVAVATITFVAVTGFEGLVGLGPAIFLGTAALGAFPAGRAMDRFGRVPVLAGGFALGILGCLLTGLGALLLSVVAVVGGFVLIGASIGMVMLSRAAAADMYPPERRGRGIALVLFGAVFGALLGPLIFIPLFANEEAAGGRLIAPWLAAAGFMAAGLVLILNVRPDPKHIGVLLAERYGEGNFRSPERAAPLTQILRRPGVVAVLLAAVASFAVMVALMSLVGYVLVGHGHHQGAIFPVVSAHFIGMFGLVLVVGNIIDRLGRLRALLGGLVLLGFSALSVVWAVESVAATAAALFGIGLGWNFSYVAATAELADRTFPIERGNILGFTDLCSGLLGAILALLGGLILSAVGLVGLGMIGLAVAVAPTFWILQTESKHSEYRE